MDLQQYHTEWILLGLGVLTIFSYLFDLLARRAKFPSVILLVLIGILGRLYVDANDLHVPFLEDLLPAVGTIGLILIVLEGAMELSLDRNKLGLVLRAFSSALTGMILTITALVLLFHYGLRMDLYVSILNAIPLSIISSAVAIPTSEGFPLNKREFIIYESSFSDILGIILFNYVLANQSFQMKIVWNFGIEVTTILAVTMICSFFLIKLLEKIEHKIKYFLPIAVLIILYEAGKLFHLSSLLMVFFFGLYIRNSKVLFPKRIGNYIHQNKNDENRKQLQMLTGESAFLVRTYFFLIFGYTIVIRRMDDLWIFIWGTVILAIIYLFRFLYLRLSEKGRITPEVYIAPRGLINILLFLSIPPEYTSDIINRYVLLVIFLGSLLVMIPGGFSMKKARKKTGSAEEVADTNSLA